MAVLSRPSLRSSARRNPDPELPATEAELVTKRLTRRQGKRTRDVSLDNESNASSKRHKQSPQEPTRHQTRATSKPVAKTLPFRDKPPVFPDHAVTQLVQRSRKLPAVLKQTSPDLTSVVGKKKVLSKPVNNVTSDPLTQNILHSADKRSLRSHDGGSRSKSELALYFPNYDDLISIEPKVADCLTPETILFMTDDTPRSATASQSKGTQKPSALSSSDTAFAKLASETVEWSDKAFSDLNDSVTIDIAALAPKSLGRTSKKDPLDDEGYIKLHRRLERQEKQLRNIEKERAMHEKVQLERLLNGLRGHDWLRVMGISGITDGEKKAYEPKRDHLIREVKVLLEKFRLWKEEEKRRKVEKEEEGEDGEDEDGEEDEGEDEEEEGDEGGSEDEEMNEEEQDEEQDQEEADEEEDEEPQAAARAISTPPDYTEIDASAARQLQLEANRASQLSQKSSSFTSSKTSPRHRRPPQASKKKSEPSTSSNPQLKQQQITSFFSKPYVRDAAIGNHRRGRSRLAFGQLVPEPQEREFELPENILTEAALAASERKHRASKRGREE